jgi:hypothetical protein
MGIGYYHTFTATSEEAPQLPESTIENLEVTYEAWVNAAERITTFHTENARLA